MLPTKEARVDSRRYLRVEREVVERQRLQECTGHAALAHNPLPVHRGCPIDEESLRNPRRRTALECIGDGTDEAAAALDEVCRKRGGGVCVKE